MDYKVINNVAENRFEIIEGTEIAVLTYHYFKGDLVLIHTEVPESLQGKGFAVALVRAALNFATEQNLKIIVHCPVVSKYVDKHSEYDHLVKADHSKDKNKDSTGKTN